jgi:hypothetical protein
VILISTDVLRQIRRDISGNLGTAGIIRIAEDNKVVPQLSERPSMTRMASREKAVEIQCCLSSQSFWKAGSARNGSQMGSSLKVPA